MLFANPCPVCGAEDEHAAWAQGVSGSPATFCPHPRERGHGTGCCCAGRSSSVFGFPPMSDEDVAAFKANFEALSSGLTVLIVPGSGLAVAESSDE